MRITRSAGARVVLGATLIVTATSALAAGGGHHVQGIDSNGLLGIDSNGVQGIDSNGALGIDSNGIQGIDSNGISGIDSNGIAGIDSNGISGIDSNGTSGIDSNGGAVLAGPVEAIDIGNRVFHSLGQIVMASDEMLSDIRVGDFVTVEGSVVSDGWLYADAVVISEINYVPGATEVFVAGMLSSIDVASGTARLGNLTIDYTPSLATGNAPSSAMWSFRGTRPAENGLMISELSNAIAK